jgi:hypothetical protein
LRAHQAHNCIQQPDATGLAIQPDWECSAQLQLQWFKSREPGLELLRVHRAEGLKSLQLLNGKGHNRFGRIEQEGMDCNLRRRLLKPRHTGTSKADCACQQITALMWAATRL